MSFPYKNPISPSQLSGQQSLERTKTYGTSYSTLSTGGYMEVYSLDQLYYTIPPSTYGPIEYSGNSIPITFSKGSGTTFSFDTLTLQPDNISSGRRKLGMLVYVYEENQIYQFLIDNYDTLWNAATGSTGTTIINDFGTTIKANSAQNISFINSWTANTIDGVSGQTYSTAVWKKYTPFTGNTSATCITDLYVENLYGCSPINVNDLLIGNSGITTTSLTANTISATTYLNLPSSPGGGISGSGTTNKIPKFTASTSIGNSIITDDGTNVTISGNEIVSGSFSGNVLFSTQSSGDEGGQLDLFVPQTNTTLSGTTISLDIYQNRFRIFESSSPNRGVYIDLSTTSNGVGTNLLSNSSFVQITANTTTTNLTYTDVAGLSITPSTTGVYEFIVVLFTGSDTAAGMRIGMSVPASSTNFYYMVQGVNSAAANQTFVEGAASGSLVTTFACNTFNGQTGVTKIDGIVTTTQSGEIKIGFAKITSGTATIRAGSYIRITKIA